MNEIKNVFGSPLGRVDSFGNVTDLLGCQVGTIDRFGSFVRPGGFPSGFNLDSSNRFVGTGGAWTGVRLDPGRFIK